MHWGVKRLVGCRFSTERQVLLEACCQCSFALPSIWEGCSGLQPAPAFSGPWRKASRPVSTLGRDAGYLEPGRVVEDSRSGVDAHPGLPLNLARGRYLVMGSGNRLRIPESGCFSSSGCPIGAGEGVEARNCPAWGRDAGLWTGSRIGVLIGTL